ncbi:hypothetical protein [Streptomyces violaceusniger]|uniref:hypothetical protein n=1 Tax=Streptomyces violaceusniger TaxID=68280 RepID=UPI0009C28EB6|nr:hypothetical protein [Streptomyces hygroscopicus]AQW55666.1 hypothetical protein SHXM_09129 [Streptomyces hygroscopicus]
MSEIRRHGIGRRHFLYGATAVATGVMSDTGCTPDDPRGSNGQGGVPVMSADDDMAVVDSEVKDNAEVSTRETPLGSSYEELVTNATVDRDGTLNVLVVNRSPESHATAHGDSLTWTFPAHSVTILRFSPEKARVTSSDRKRTSHV